MESFPLHFHRYSGGKATYCLHRKSILEQTFRPINAFKNREHFDFID